MVPHICKHLPDGEAERSGVEGLTTGSARRDLC